MENYWSSFKAWFSENTVTFEEFRNRTAHGVAQLGTFFILMLIIWAKFISTSESEPLPPPADMFESIYMTSLSVFLFILIVSIIFYWSSYLILAALKIHTKFFNPNVEKDLDKDSQRH